MSESTSAAIKPTPEERLAAQEEWGHWCSAHKAHMRLGSACCESFGACGHPQRCNVVRLVTDPLAPAAARSPTGDRGTP